MYFYAQTPAKITCTRKPWFFETKPKIFRFESHSNTFLKTVSNFPTTHLAKSLVQHISPLVGKLDTVFQDGVEFSPLVGKLDTVSKNGVEFPHWWGNWTPFRKTVSNFPTVTGICT